MGAGEYLVIGGHITPAVAVIEQMQHQGLTPIRLVGRQTVDVHGSPSYESEIASQLGIGYLELDLPKPGNTLISKLIYLGKLVWSWGRLLGRFIWKRPRLIVSFGGYVSFPVLLAAVCLRIPYIIHEQTSVMGKANRLFAPLAAQVAISWRDTRFAPATAKVTGNPIRHQFLSPPQKPSWMPGTKRPLILITGGNQGARRLNYWLFDHLDKFLDSYVIVHQTGSTQNQADYKQAQKLKQTNDRSRRYYLPQTRLSAADMRWCMENAAVVVSRAGANTVTELLVVGAKVIFVPLPIAADNEQMLNAHLVREYLRSIIVEQSQLDQLYDKLIRLISVKPLPVNQKVVDLHLQAAQSLVDLIRQCQDQK